WASAQQDDVQLRYKFKKGEKYVYHQKALVKQTQTVKDMKIETEIKQDSLGVWTLDESTAQGNMQITTENKELTAQIKIGTFGELTYDSKDKSKNKNTLPGADPTP